MIKNNPDGSKMDLGKIAYKIDSLLLSEKFGNTAAAFTHFIHHKDGPSKEFYKDSAIDFIWNVMEKEYPDAIISPLIINEFLNLYLKKYYKKPPFNSVKSPAFSFIDLFAGIGGFRLAMQEHKGKSVFSSEWDRYSKKTYYKNYGELPFGDITKIGVNEIPDHDILTGGFPCQPFSLAGVSKKNSLGRNHGFLDETQGTLFFDIARIISSKRPKAFILENVKNLKSHDKGKTIEVIKQTLEEKLGYKIYTQVIDAKYYVPQHRERIFIVGFNRDLIDTSEDFKFPAHSDQPKILRESDVLQTEVDEKYTLSDKLWSYLKNYAEKHRLKGNGFGYGIADPDGVTRTLSARYHKDGSEILISRGENKNPRRLTPEECKDLMGFPKDFLTRDIGVSDTQLYRQFGNSVALPVVKAVAQKVIQYMAENTFDLSDLKEIEVKEAVTEDPEQRITA